MSGRPQHEISPQAWAEYFPQYLDGLSLKKICKLTGTSQYVWMRELKRLGVYRDISKIIELKRANKSIGISCQQRHELNKSNPHLEPSQAWDISRSGELLKKSIRVSV